MKKLLHLILGLFLLSGCTLVKTIPEKIELPITLEKEEIEPEVIFNIGAILPLEGEMEKTGINILKAIDLAVLDFNQKIGNHKKVLMYYENGGCNQETAKDATIRLINDHEVKAIIGGVCSKETHGIAQIANQKKVPILAIHSTDPDIRKNGEYIFRLNADDKIQAEKAAEFMFQDLDSPNVFTLFENSIFAQQLVTEFENYYKGKIAGSYIFGRDQADFTDFYANFSEEKSTALFLVSMPNQINKIIDILKSSNQKITLLGTDTLNDLTLSDIEMQNNLDFFIISPHKENQVKWTEFSYNFQLKYEELPAYGAAEGYDAINILIDLIRKGAGTSKIIFEALNSMGQYAGASGDILFDLNGENIGQKWDIYKITDQEIKLFKNL
jgi:branched-chain amino acid transport system substrate-binding protein